MSNSALFPNTYKGKIYPSSGSNFSFPEQAYPEYSPSKKPWAVCFSGGGARAMSAALGQMRGMTAEGTMNYVGAISCVSGGGWFGTIYSYASSAINDSTLLGPIVAPGDLTVSGLQNIDQNCIGYPITQMYNAPVIASLSFFYLQYQLGYLPFNRLWSRMLNTLMLTNFNIENTDTFFSLNSDTVNKIIAQNPSLTPSNFYTLRPNRPFFIAGGTQVYPVGGNNQIMRHMEYTSMYSGTSQVIPNPIGPGGTHYGGGYTDNFIFDTYEPSLPDNNNNVTIQRDSSQQFFLLSDQMGSSSSAPGSAIDFLAGNDGWFPEFNYWSPKFAGKEQSVLYSFTDGGNLENTGIVPLLRRQYPLVIAFVNTPYPLGSVDQYFCVDGIDAQISRLFGHYPPNDPIFPPMPPIQIFNDNGKFQALVNGLNAAKAAGKAVMYTDTYTIYPNNYFGIPAYPGSGQVMVVWVYNDINSSWVKQLPNNPSNNVRALLQSKDPANYMANFPNYDTVDQNSTYEDGVWVPEVLQLTAQQVNLLANMHCYNITNDDVGKTLKSLIGK